LSWETHDGSLDHELTFDDEADRPHIV
jgi:hypothetical protein